MVDVLAGYRAFADDGTPVFSKSFLRNAESVRDARQFVRAVLLDLEVPDLADTAELVVSELASNAVLHARFGSFRVTVGRADGDRVRVAVTDHSRVLPRPVDADESEDNGRGLAIVEAVSAKWGTDLLNWGKRVWAELEAPPPVELPANRVPIYTGPLAQLTYVLLMVAVAAAVTIGLMGQR
ncbi:ATP-binding protein [Streptomyces griseoviridis]|uniref:ATP-binding protein n=1 Tax=Streptomyces griseoviridis TaxID=45398 RepID=UPI0033E91637